MRLIDADKIPYFEAVNDNLENTGKFYARREDIDALPTIDEEEEIICLRNENDELSTMIKLNKDIIKEKQHENELRYRDGIINGLKYAIRYYRTGGDNNS